MQSNLKCSTWTFRVCLCFTEKRAFTVVFYVEKFDWKKGTKQSERLFYLDEFKQMPDNQFMSIKELLFGKIDNNNDKNVFGLSDGFNVNFCQSNASAM